MTNAAYVLGALDALVKAGELSPAYAGGVVSVLEKEAGFFWDSPTQNYNEEVERFLANNPGRMDPRTQKMRISSDEATQLIDNSRHWWTGLGRRSSDYWGNRARKWMRWWPGTKMAGAQYDREIEDRRNAFRRDYMADMRRSGAAFRPEIEAAVQDKHVRDANRRLEDAKQLMLPAERRNVGITDNYADKYRSDFGTSAYAGGAGGGGGFYTPQHDAQAPAPKKPNYGKGLPSLYGTNSALFYRQDYVNPLNQ